MIPTLFPLCLAADAARPDEARYAWDPGAALGCGALYELSPNKMALIAIGVGVGDLAEGALEWVDWFNNRRLLEPPGNIPPAEAEARYHAQVGAPRYRSATQTNWPPAEPERFKHSDLRVPSAISANGLGGFSGGFEVWAARVFLS